MNKKLPCLFILSFFAFTLRASPPPPAQGAYKPTPDQIEKVHSRLFNKGIFGQITDMLSKGTGDVHLPCIVGISQHIQVPFSRQLLALAADSDLVVLAKAETGTSHMSANKDFLYTDWYFVAEEILKNNSYSAVGTDATILVTRPGGKLQVNGRTVYADCPNFLSFANRQQYLLFLRFIPETGAYALHWGSAAFLVSTPRAKRLDDSDEPEVTDKDTLLKNVRDAVVISRTMPPVPRS